MESRLQDHERIRGGLFFIQNIPRDENWKVRRDILAAYDPNKTIHNNSNTNETGESDKVVQELNRQPNGTFVGIVYIESRQKDLKTCFRFCHIFGTRKCSTSCFFELTITNANKQINIFFNFQRCGKV